MLSLQTKRTCVHCGNVGRPEISGVVASQVAYLGWMFLVISLFQPILLIATGGIFLWMVFTKKVACKNCNKEFLTYEKIKETYTKDTYNDNNSSSNQNDSDKNNNSKHKKSNEKPNETQNNRVFTCPICKQKIRVYLPLPKSIGKCKNCSSRFSVYADNEGHMYIESILKEGDCEHINSITSIDDCFALLEVSKNASKLEIKRAYKKKIMEYHPDKVNRLGHKLKLLADKESKKLNYAVIMLKKNGYV